jgi:SAM-dependent methyltransferase
MKSWIEYWDGDHPIYVNPRHRLLHYQFLARDLAQLIPDREAIILDFGCGEAEGAGAIALHCRKLYLADAAPNVRANLAQRFADNGRIDVLSPEQVDDLPEASLDLVIVHSVSQYIPKPDLSDLLSKLVDKLRDGGRIVLGDLIPENLSAMADAKALLEFGWKGGFLLASLLGLVRAALSDYRKLRQNLGLTRYDESEILGVLEGLGLTARRLEHNPGHNQARFAVIGLKVAPLE